MAIVMGPFFVFHCNAHLCRIKISNTSKLTTGINGFFYFSCFGCISSRFAIASPGSFLIDLRFVAFVFFFISSYWTVAYPRGFPIDLAYNFLFFLYFFILDECIMPKAGLLYLRLALLYLFRYFILPWAGWLDHNDFGSLWTYVMGLVLFFKLKFYILYKYLFIWFERGLFSKSKREMYN